MLKFKEFLAEMFLLEGKIDDLKVQNPSLHREIDAYADADLSPTKKFVPWLVSQHKKGNVTPDHPDLHQILGNYDRYRNIHGIKDHASKNKVPETPEILMRNPPELNSLPLPQPLQETTEPVMKSDSN